MNNFMIALLGFLLVVGGLIVSVISSCVSLWFRAIVSSAHVSMLSIIGMRIRKVNPRLIVDSKINLTKAGLKDISVSELETHYLAGGNLSEVVRACIAADKANIELTWKQATAIDLAGRDLFDAVKTSVHPKVIDCPKSGSGKYISAVCKNGIELLVRARVTVRTNIMQLVGGATEETIIARVGEGIVNAIGSADSHYDVLQSPHTISETVARKELDRGTAFAILSIDIADINVGKYVGAVLQSEQAQADMKVAQAKAEGKKSMAIALEQENKAKLVEAEARIPEAIASAFERGQLGIMDYQKMKNVMADTDMRLALASESGEEEL
ncbi:flotillin-like protein FloA [bacterium]|nr:flotillin-like protein FloA [bacterium]